MNKKIFGDYEVVWYSDGEYDLLDIEVNGLTNKQLENRIRKELVGKFITDKCDQDRVLSEGIYLLPYDTLIRFKDIGSKVFKKRPDYEKGYNILADYFDSISDEEKPKVNRALKRAGL